MQENAKLPIKTVYYSDEANDEFSDAKINARVIDSKYVYLSKNPFWNVIRFVLHKIIAPPIAFPYTKIILGHKVKNKSVLKGFRKKGYFLYANHTQQIGDAVMPSTTLFPKGVFTIVHPDNVSIPFWGRVTQYLGAIPTPTSLSAMRNFRNAIEKRILEGACVTIYPEAHIWPYCTKIRNFPSTSMSFPVDFDEPSFSMTTTYKKRRFFKKPRPVSYIDGPFYPDKALPRKDRIEKLRNDIYEAMSARTKESDCEYIRYVKIETERKPEND